MELETDIQQQSSDGHQVQVVLVGSIDLKKQAGAAEWGSNICQPYYQCCLQEVVQHLWISGSDQEFLPSCRQKKDNWNAGATYDNNWNTRQRTTKIGMSGDVRRQLERRATNNNNCNVEQSTRTSSDQLQQLERRMIYGDN